MAIPAKVAGVSVWMISLVAILIAYVAYRNYDQNGNFLDFSV